MPVSFYCSSCGTKLSCPDNLVGQQGKCRSCGATITVPAISSVGFLQKATETTADSNASRLRNMIEARRNSVVLIETPTNLGAGLIISKDGLAVTNAHVVEVGGTYSVTLGNGQSTVALRLHRHPSLDLAVVKLKDISPAFLDLRTECAEDIDSGDEVVAIGHPKGLRFTSTKGIVSSPRRILDDGNIYVQTDVAINPGNSGGPLLTTSGKLVGLNTIMYNDSQGLGFAIPASSIVEYVKTVQHLQRAGDILEPNSDDFEHKRLSTIEIIEAALNTLGLPFEREEGECGDVWVEFGDSLIIISFRNEMVAFLANITSLTETEVNNPHLLLHLLKRNVVNPVPFCAYLNEDEELMLHVSTSRPVEGLDVNEVVFLLSQIMDRINNSKYLCDFDITSEFDEYDHQTYWFGDP